MIPITDRHLWEACGLAMEQDIADLTAQSCNHRFSEDFHESIRQMQEKSSDKHAAKISRPLWRFLPAAAMIALVCLAGFRLLDLAPFRMGSPGPGYGKGAEEAAGQEAGTDRKEVGEYATDTETTGAAEGAMQDSEEIPGGAAVEEAAGEEAGRPDLETEKELIRDGIDNEKDGGTLPESAQSQTDSSTDDSASRKENGTRNENPSENGTSVRTVNLLSITYYASTHILALELRNDSDKTIDLENTWMLFNSDGDTVNTEANTSGLSNPSRLYPQKTATLRCILPDGDRPEGEYTLELEDREIILSFSFP